MSHLSQGYMHAHAVYGAAIANQPQKDTLSTDLQNRYTKAIRSIQKTLENPHEYIESFIIREILKIGTAYIQIRSEIEKWTHLKNRLKANAKNKELGIYVTVLQQTKMYETLSKLLSPTVGHTSKIQTAACKTLALIVFRPNRYRNAEWYSKKQKRIALNAFNINGSQYTVLLLISHILHIDLLNYNNLLIYDNLKLICYALELLSNLINHNSDVIIAINKQFKFISMIFKILNNNLFFELTLNNKNNNNNNNKNNKCTLTQIALYTLINGLNALLNMSQHNETNRIEFYEMNGWNFICKCLKHNCMEVRELSLCFINTLCVCSKLSIKYFLNSTFNNTESFQILLNMIHKICIFINKNENKNNNMKRIDSILCKLICSLSSLCNNNMIGYRKFCLHKSWKIIRKLLQTINNNKIDYKFSKTLNLQIFSLLSCFNVPHSYEKWKELQWNIMFKNAPKKKNNLDFGKKKLTMKEKKLAQKKDSKTAENEYKKTQRICKEIIRMLGGYVHSSESPSPNANHNNEEEYNEEEEEEDESYNRDIILKYLFESFSTIDYVIGSICALGKLCKLKHNGNIIRLDQIIEIIKRENIEKYNKSLNGLKDKMSRSFTKMQFINDNEFNQLIYFVNGLNDIFDGIINNENNENGKQIRDLLLKTNVIFVICRVITQPINAFFMQHAQYSHSHSQNNNKIDYKLRYKKINNLKLNAANALGKVIKFDVKMQMFFGQWIQNFYHALKNLAINNNNSNSNANNNDNLLLQISIAYVIQFACFKPINNQNIKQLRAFNIEHLLNQLYKQAQNINGLRIN